MAGENTAGKDTTEARGEKARHFGTKRQDHMGPYVGLRNFIYQKAVRFLIRI